MKTFVYFLLLSVAAFSANAKNIKKSSQNVVRIIKGDDAEDGFAPYQISIQSRSEGHFCGGAIIDERYILTAAHCLEDKSTEDMYVVTGTNKWQTPGAKYNVEEKKTHINFSYGEYHDDIALLRLTRSIEWNDHTKPIKLPFEQNLKPGTTLTLTGWGWMNFDTSELAEKLQKLSEKYISYDECYDKLNELQDFLSNGSICGFPEKGKGSCLFDSGGPLVTENNELVGILSWGNPCALGYPDVYTSTFYFRDWIHDAMKELEEG